MHEQVMCLARQARRGSVVYMDNYFNSVHTLREMAELGVLGCGTVRVGRGVHESTMLPVEGAARGEFRFAMAEMALG